MTNTFRIVLGSIGAALALTAALIVLPGAVGAQVAPTCTIAANPASVPGGGSTTLTWTSSGASSASINHGIGPVNIAGTWFVSLLSVDRTYTMTVNGAGGSSTCAVTVNVANTQAPTCTLSANPSNVSGGNPSVLTWTTNNAVSTTLTSVGAVPPSGAYTVNPNVTTTYTLTATNPHGSNTCARTVTVGGGAGSGTPTCSISASPAHFTVLPGSTTLTWNTDNAHSTFIDNGVGFVPADGTHVVPDIFGNRTFRLTAVGANGTETCTANVTTKHGTGFGGPRCEIHARPQSTSYNGSVVLNWTSSPDTVAASLNQSIGAVQKVGSRVVDSITDAKMYTLTVRNGNRQTNTCNTTVFVDRAMPTCSIEASDSVIRPGQSTVLSWSVGNASFVDIKPEIGRAPATGTATVRPVTTTVYNMTVDGVGGPRSCNKTIRVSHSVLGGFLGGLFPSFQLPQLGFGSTGPLTQTGTSAHVASVTSGSAYPVQGYTGNATGGGAYPAPAKTHTSKVTGGGSAYSAPVTTYAGSVPSAVAYSPPTQAHVVGGVPAGIPDGVSYPVGQRPLTAGGIPIVHATPSYPAQASVSINAVPYTGPNDALYVFSMLLISIAVGFILFRNRRIVLG